jgi:hypothetical protein
MRLASSSLGGWVAGDPFMSPPPSRANARAPRVASCLKIHLGPPRLHHEQHRLRLAR